MARSSLATPLTNGSTPRKPMSGVSRRLRRQMLAAAEADLQPQGSRRPVEEGQRIEGLAGLELEADTRQQLAQQLPGTVDAV